MQSWLWSVSGARSLLKSPEVLSSTFNVRNSTSHYTGGTIGRNVGWFQGDASSFFGLRYQIGDRLSIESEYTSDLMLNESSYLDLKSPWNFGLTYKINNYLNLSAQYLHGKPNCRCCPY